MTRSAGPRQWDCPQARIALGVYVLGAIDPAEQALVDAHLDGCDACQAEMAGARGLAGPARPRFRRRGGGGRRRHRAAGSGGH